MRISSRCSSCLLALAFASAASAADAALAADLTKSFSTPYSFPYSIGSQVIQLNQFNPAVWGGELTGVELFLQTTIGGNVTAENESASPGSITINLTGSTTTTGPLGITTTAALAKSVGPVPVGASNGVAGSGPDFLNFGRIEVSGASRSGLFTPSDLSPFIGSGKVFISMSGTGKVEATGVDSALNISNFGPQGNMQIRYYYTTIPEPSTCLLAGLGAVIVGASVYRRRRVG